MFICFLLLLVLVYYYMITKHLDSYRSLISVLRNTHFRKTI